MKLHKKILFLCVLIVPFSCTDSILEEYTSSNVFEIFWKTMDERYVFFEEKDINWDSIYTEYAPKFVEASDNEMKTFFQQIIDYVGDRHISINYFVDSSAIGIERPRVPISIWRAITYSEIKNVNDTSCISIIGQFEDSITYLFINDFREEVNIQELQTLLLDYNCQNGLIMDLRENFGGYSHIVKTFASIFYSEDRIVYYSKYKTGKDRQNFSDYSPIASVGTGIIPENIPKAVLCNPNTYSAGNLFVSIMRDVVKNCTIIGEQSGGGGGSVSSITLPNSWSLTFTVIKDYNVKKELLEYGVEPDIKVELTDSFIESVQHKTGEDPQLQKAINHLKRNCQ